MSKLFFLLALLPLFATLSSQAQEEGDFSELAPRVFMIVDKHSGFVPAPHSYHVRCQIRRDWTIRQFSKGGRAERVVWRRTIFPRAVPDSASASRYLYQAARGVIRETRGPTDRPTSKIEGILSPDLRVLLLDDQSHLIRRNTSLAATRLIMMANLNCPVP